MNSTIYASICWILVYRHNRDQIDIKTLLTISVEVVKYGHNFRWTKTAFNIYYSVVDNISEKWLRSGSFLGCYQEAISHCSTPGVLLIDFSLKVFLLMMIKQTDKTYQGHLNIWLHWPTDSCHLWELSTSLHGSTSLLSALIFCQILI